MRIAVTWLVRAVLGGTVDRRVRPIVAFTFLYAVSFSTFWVYAGVFAVKGLGARPVQVGTMFLASAPAAGVANYLAGHVSDRLGRKAPIVLSFLAASATVAGLASIGRNVAFGFALVVLLGVVGAPAYSLDRVLVADVVPDGEGREHAYATVRIASNLGVLLGPPLGALLIHFGGWRAFLIAIAVIGLVGAAVALAFLPATVAASVPRPPASGAVLRVLVQNRAFVLLLASTLFGFVVFVAYETVLPVIATTDYGLAPATWGLLAAISPLLVVSLQLRLTRATARTPTSRRLAGSLLLMGASFLALIVSSQLAVVAAVIVVFILGEMIWMPTSQALAAELAPPESRGTYFGTLNAMPGAAWTLAPFVALQLRASAGVPSLWTFFALAGLAAALIGWVAARNVTVPATSAPTRRAGAKAGSDRP